jgi:quinol monooxygenase YgiN
MELFIFARFHAREGEQGAVEAALREEIPQARAEPGCIAIDAYCSTRDPRLFFIHSRWTDERAFDIHAEMSHTVHFLKRVEPLIDHALDVNRTQSLEIRERIREEI